MVSPIRTSPEVKTSEADSRPSAPTAAECASQPTAILSIASDPLTAIPRIAIFLALSILFRPVPALPEV